MSTYTHIALNSFKISIGLVLCDSLACLTLSNYLNTFELLGDLLLVEAAALFLTAGLIDFGSSLGIVQLRKNLNQGNDGFDMAKRKATERRAVVLVLSGAFLLLALVLLSIFKSRL